MYSLLFLVTVAWAWWEVGTDGWALVPRTVGPAVLLVCVILLAPTLRAYRHAFELPATVAVGTLMLVGTGYMMFVSSNAAAAVSVPGTAAGAAMSDSSLLKAGADWPAYGGSYSARRYSPLDQINPTNVSQLTRAWVFHTGDLPSDETRNTYGAETTPLKVGNLLYVCTPKNILIAVEASTGKQRWRYDPRVPDAFIPYTAACRGVAYFAVPDADPAQLCAARVFEGTLDGRLVAVDAESGKPCMSFGYGGQVDTATGIGRHDPGMYSITSPPTVIRGVVVVGHQILDGQKRDAPSGVIQGYDAVSGKLRWAWDMARPDGAAPPALGETYSRGTPNMWTTASGDEQLGLVYLPLGVSAVDYWSGSRSEVEKQFATSLVAIDVTSGKPAWHFQTVHNDVWDYDLGSQATLADFPDKTGQSVPALVLPSKRGDIFVLGRRTGEPLVGVEERPVPQGGVEPKERAKTQPFSSYHTLRRPDLTERDMWGISPIDQMVCRIQFRRADYQGMAVSRSIRSAASSLPTTTTCRTITGWFRATRPIGAAGLRGSRRAGRSEVRKGPGIHSRVHRTPSTSTPAGVCLSRACSASSHLTAASAPSI